MPVNECNVDREHGDLELLHRLARYFDAQHLPAYLVGGALRDLLVGQPWTDWDIVVDAQGAHGAQGAHASARALASHLGGHYAYLHERASRIILKANGRERSIDVSPVQGGSLDADLRLRDFTINAMACPLVSFIAYSETGSALQLIDPLHGASDLADRILRVTSPEAFEHDPLRMLRAVRLMTRFGLTLDETTAALMRRDAPSLAGVASERLREELYAILAPHGAVDRLHLLDEQQLLAVLIPELMPAKGMQQPRLHHWDVFEHSLQTVAALEQLTTLFAQAPEASQALPLARHAGSSLEQLLQLRVLLHEAEEQGIFQLAHLNSSVGKLAALLHDIGKTVTRTVDEEGAIRFYGHPQAGAPLAYQIMKRLGASTHDRRLVQQIVANHMRPGQLSHDALTPRAVRRFFLDLGPRGMMVALISLADHLAMRGPEPLTDTWQRHVNTVYELLERYVRTRDRVLPPRIVQPEEIMRRLNVSPGPVVGVLLDAIAEAQAEGKVQSKDDAFWLAEERLNQMM